jgi:PemK-like, MazF-like toxin of type II toxin-antitoxin system
VPSIIRGRVIFPKVAVADPQGQNPKPDRPFIVISRDDEIKQGGSIQAIGITSDLQASPKEHYVSLPFGPNAKTGLRKQSAALCTWLIDVAQDKVEVGKGYVHPNIVNEIVVKVLELKIISQGDIENIDTDGN